MYLLEFCTRKPSLLPHSEYERNNSIMEKKITDKILKWRQLRNEEVGNFQQLTIKALKDVPDQFVSVIYAISADPLKKFLKEQKEKSKVKLSFTHVLNKLLALAINENPAHNQVVLGNKIYQIEGIHISNILLLPGKEQAMINLILDDPHLKSLEQIAIELKELHDVKLQRYESKQKEFSTANMAFYKFLYASKLYKIVSEKLFFKTCFKTGIFSNLVLSN